MLIFFLLLLSFAIFLINDLFIKSLLKRIEDSQIRLLFIIKIELQVFSKLLSKFSTSRVLTNQFHKKFNIETIF